jgi:hypothetical protein
VVAAIASLEASTPRSSASLRPIRAAVIAEVTFGVFPLSNDCASEQPLGEWHSKEGRDAHPAGGLAEDSDLTPVPAKCGDVLLHPFQGGDLISSLPPRLSTITSMRASHGGRQLSAPETGKLVAPRATRLVLNQSGELKCIPPRLTGCRGAAPYGR